jgi:type VI secretion system protein
MSAASLLKRLEHAADPHSTDRHTWRDQDLEAAVVSHLKILLNTRQGSCSTAPDYGLPEISEVLYDFPEAIGIMQRAIKNLLQTYEPRLKNVQVRHVKNEFVHEMFLEFEITGQVAYPDGRRQQVRFTTQVDGSTNCTVK